ncbi:putative rossmann-like alpha/beta/alpha sandwich protein [Helianthus annuus]|nr:putative rossmann-like alpha/beta/alpha sandwich protein [Helianthus annuus]
MAFTNCSSLAHLETSSKHSIITSSFSISPRLSSSSFSSSSINRKLSVPPNLLKIDRTAAVRPQAAAANAVAEAFTEFKHLLLPITDRNPYLSEGTRQAAATTAALAKKYGADITVVVIDEKLKESLPEHDTQLSSIRWHLSEGRLAFNPKIILFCGFQEFKLLERLGEGSKPTAIIGEIADDMNLDLVIMSMEAIHSKHVDANLLAEFIPCPVILLPL